MRRLIQQLLQILTITGFLQALRLGIDLLSGNPAVVIRDFFQASDLQALAMLDGMHEVTGFKQRVVGMFRFMRDASLTLCRSTLAEANELREFGLGCAAADDLRSSIYAFCERVGQPCNVNRCACV